CAAKIERDVGRLPQVEEATLVFATKQLRVKTNAPDGLTEEIQRIAQSYEPDITVSDRDSAKKAHAHHHEQGEECGCGHDHEHEHHHHEHDEECGCGHDHGHEHHHHEHGEECCCGHDHEHEHHHDDDDDLPLKKSGTVGGTTVTYTIENLDCANCGAKIERRIQAMDGVSDAVLTFATKQLRVTAPNHDGLAERMVQTARAIEPDVQILAPQKAKKTAKSDDSEKKEERREIMELVIGAICMALGLALKSVSMPATFVICAVGYIILGREIVWTAVRNLFSGHVFDENFLMTIATLGAFVIGDYPEAVGVMLFFRIGELFEHRAVEKSRSQIMEAVDLRPETVQLESGGIVETIPAEEAEVGDILVVRPGDRVPLDGAVIEGESFLDTSAVTGEPVPVRVTAGDALVSGWVNTSGLLRMRVEKPLSESMVTRILDAVENAAASKPKIDRFITRFSRIYTPIVVAVAALTAIIPSIITGDWNHWVYTALTFLVISCPCALVLSVPLAFFSGIGTASRRGILFKGGASLEALAAIKAAALDKTGTITRGTFTVTAIEPGKDISADQLLRLAACCEQNSTHPIAASIAAAAAERGITLQTLHEVEEIAGHGVRAVVDDSTVLCGNRKLMEQNGISLPELSAAGGATVVYVACGGQFAGRLLISDTIKDDAKQAIAEMKRLGVTSAMLTGDSAESADAIAAQTGIDAVYAHLLPENKLERLREIREKYGPVLFVGDGINDAPVLAGADVGAAMGSGADAAIEAADVVFLTGELSAVPQAVALAKQTARVSKQNIVFALAIKLAVMVLGLLGIASMWLAVFADTGVAMLCVLNSIRLLYKK
ncbi:heavy metal translocating P-type ATPase, partial [Butyricicoccus sp.]|uniref:heavy metal translocating P-type ATPase n=1 Tax=Butyricicoccus sp. TaxID=2049021 RepID=UPI0037364665